MIAAWFAAAFFGNLAAGAVGTLWSTLSAHQFFLITAGLAGVAGVFLLIISPWARRTEALTATRTQIAGAEGSQPPVPSRIRG
jgi:POT family proton-dependent oligopeptide transporter